MATERERHDELRRSIESGLANIASSATSAIETGFASVVGEMKRRRRSRSGDRAATDHLDGAERNEVESQPSQVSSPMKTNEPVERSRRAVAGFGFGEEQDFGEEEEDEAGDYRLSLLDSEEAETLEEANRVKGGAEDNPSSSSAAEIATDRESYGYNLSQGQLQELLSIAQSLERTPASLMSAFHAAKSDKVKDFGGGLSAYVKDLLGNRMKIHIQSEVKAARDSATNLRTRQRSSLNFPTEVTEEWFAGSSEVEFFTSFILGLNVPAGTQLHQSLRAGFLSLHGGLAWQRESRVFGASRPYLRAIHDLWEWARK